MSRRLTDTASNSHAEADRCTDAYTGTHLRAHAERDVRGGHVLAVADAAADGIAQSDAGTGTGAEPRARDARIDRLGGDDRRVGVDLASLPQLARTRHRSSVLSGSHPWLNPPLDRSERVTTITRT
jgi:hypothetical protein